MKSPRTPINEARDRLCAIDGGNRRSYEALTVLIAQPEAECVLPQIHRVLNLIQDDAETALAVAMRQLGRALERIA